MGQHVENHGSGTTQTSAAIEPSQSLVSTPKKRSQADKKGRIRYTLELLHNIEERLDNIQKTQHYIVTGLQLAEYIQFNQPYIESIVCKDEIDKEILRVLFEAGHRGILPKDVISKIRDPKLWDRWQVFHRIEHMNKRLDKEIGKKVAEKRGHEWTLIQFAYDAYDLTKKELERQEKEETGKIPV